MKLFASFTTRKAGGRKRIKIPDQVVKLKELEYNIGDELERQLTYKGFSNVFYELQDSGKEELYIYIDAIDNRDGKEVVPIKFINKDELLKVASKYGVDKVEPYKKEGLKLTFKKEGRK